jgi:hypothetical protein
LSDPDPISVYIRQITFSLHVDSSGNLGLFRFLLERAKYEIYFWRGLRGNNIRKLEKTFRTVKFTQKRKSDNKTIESKKND